MYRSMSSGQAQGNQAQNSGARRRQANHQGNLLINLASGVLPESSDHRGPHSTMSIIPRDHLGTTLAGLLFFSGFFQTTYIAKCLPGHTSVAHHAYPTTGRAYVVIRIHDGPKNTIYSLRVHTILGSAYYISPPARGAEPSTPLLLQRNSSTLYPKTRVAPVGTYQWVNHFSTAVSFWGQLGTNYLEFEWFVPKTGLEF